jgi:hypothetical protein
MMMSYRFPILIAICVTCLGFTANDSRRELLLLASSNTHKSLSATELLAQASTTDNTKASSSSTANSAYDRYMRAGYEVSQKKDYQTALENFKKALAERPSDRYAQQAIQNMEAQQAIHNNATSGLWWMSLGVGLAVAVGGGVFFFSGLMRKSSLPEKEQELANAHFEANPSLKSRAELNSFEREKKFELPSLPPETSQNRFTDNNSKAHKEEDNSIPLQTPTRIPNLDPIDELVKDLQEPDPKKRRKAIWEIAQKGDSRAMKPLVDLMIDSDSQERSLILEALSQISIRTLKPMNQALAISLQDKNPQVRKNAIRDLTRIYDLMSQISQMLRHAIDDSDAEVQETAKWALNQLNLQMSPTRLELLPMKQNESTP